MEKGLRNRPWGSCSAFTLVEVSIAAMVLGLTIASSIVALRTGFATIETARNNGLAGQVLQSEMENLRLMSWSQISALTTGEFSIESTFEGTVAESFSLNRVVRDPQPSLREITLEVSWTASTGRTSTRSYVSFFSQNGLNDYYYRVLPR